MAITDLISWRRERQTPVRREEENPFTAFRREMDRLFEDFWGERAMAPFGEEWGAFSPQVDVTETDGEIKVSAELPGLDDEDIDLSISNNVLTIKGEKKEEQEEKGDNYYRSERAYGAFRRDVSLPSDVNTDQVDAVYDKGVLTITMPKAEKTKATKIAVKAQAR